MEEKKKKKPVIIFEIILTIILIPIIFYGTLVSFNWKLFEKFLWYPLLSLLPNNMFLVFVFILGFDFLWVMAVKFLPIKSKRFKIYSSLFIITISFAVLTFLVVMTGFGEAMH